MWSRRQPGRGVGGAEGEGRRGNSIHRVERVVFGDGRHQSGRQPRVALLCPQAGLHKALVEFLDVCSQLKVVALHRGGIVPGHLPAEGRDLLHVVAALLHLQQKILGQAKGIGGREGKRWEYMYTHTHTHTQSCMHACMHACMHTHTHVLTSNCWQKHTRAVSSSRWHGTYTSTHTHTHTLTLAHTHTHTHTHTHDRP